MEKERLVGLDIGLNNVGWAVIDRAIDEDSVEILACGTYVFPSPLADLHKPEEGTKNRQRGHFRRSRQTLERRHKRKMRLYRLLADAGFLPRTYRERVRYLCRNKDPKTGYEVTPYALRAAALDHELEPFELGRALCHINQRRGFLSPRDLLASGAFFADEGEEDFDDEESGQIKKEIKRTEEAMEAEGARTIGEFLYKRQKNGLPVRKKEVKDRKQQKVLDEQRYVRADRQMMQKEFREIMKVQAEHHPMLTAELQQQIKDIIFGQLPLTTRKKMRGKCAMFPKELTCPRASLTAQRFILAQDVAHLEFIDLSSGEVRKLTPEHRKLLVTELMKGEDLTWPQVKELLDLRDGLFNREPLPKVKGIKKAFPESGKLLKLKGSETVRRIRTVIGEKWDLLDAQAQRELVGELVSIRDWFETPRIQRSRPAAVRRKDLIASKTYGPNQVQFTADEAAKLATLPLPEGYMSLSTKAIKKVVGPMLEEKVYSEAVEAVGRVHTNLSNAAPEEVTRLSYPKDAEIRNPAVLCSVRSAVRVLNSIVQEYGKPDSLRIELARDVQMNAKKRVEAEKDNREKEKARKDIINELIANRIKPTRKNVQKVLLWRELGDSGLPYEPHVRVGSISELFDREIEVDHIVPRSHNLDNSMMNLTLCTRDFNIHRKGNRTLYEAMGSTDSPEWGEIRRHVMAIKSMPLKKRNLILAKKRPEDFVGRHLSATTYIGKEVLKLGQKLMGNPAKVIVARGQITSELRRDWGLNNIVPLHPEEQAKLDEHKKSMEEAIAAGADDADIKEAPKARSNYKHHALDAIVVALTDMRTLQALTRYFQQKDDSSIHWDREERNEKQAQMLPDPMLRAKVAEAIEAARIVHRPNRKVKGQLHNQQPVKFDPADFPTGKPRSWKVVGNKIVRYDDLGRPAQVYELQSNHHVVIFESLEPNSKGVYERYAEVVPTIEAKRRKDKGEPVICKESIQPGWKFVMSICPRDTIELEDGSVGVVSKISTTHKEGIPYITIWQPFASTQLGKINLDNPYLLINSVSEKSMRQLAFRIIQDPLGRIAYRESAQ